MLSNVIASSVKNVTLFRMDPAVVADKYMGVSEKFVKATFAEMAARRPSILIIDEVLDGTK